MIQVNTRWRACGIPTENGKINSFQSFHFHPRRGFKQHVVVHGSENHFNSIRDLHFDNNPSLDPSSGAFALLSLSPFLRSMILALDKQCFSKTFTNINPGFIQTQHNTLAAYAFIPFIKFISHLTYLFLVPPTVKITKNETVDTSMKFTYKIDVLGAENLKSIDIKYYEVRFRKARYES